MSWSEGNFPKITILKLHVLKEFVKSKFIYQILLNTNVEYVYLQHGISKKVYAAKVDVDNGPEKFAAMIDKITRSVLACKLQPPLSSACCRLCSWTDNYIQPEKY